MNTYWKATREDGTDFHTGTVDYAAAVGGEPLTPHLPDDTGTTCRHAPWVFPGPGWLHLARARGGGVVTRRWGFGSMLATGLAAQSTEPGAADLQPSPSLPVPGPDAPPRVARAGDRHLSWDREDAAISAGECPWCPDLDFPDTAALVRHVVAHARAWEAEALHTERLRRSLEGAVREFTTDVRVMAASILGEEAP